MAIKSIVSMSDSSCLEIEDEFAKSIEEIGEFELRIHSRPQLNMAAEWLLVATVVFIATKPFFNAYFARLGERAADGTVSAFAKMYQAVAKKAERIYGRKDFEKAAQLEIENTDEMAEHGLGKVIAPIEIQILDTEINGIICTFRLIVPYGLQREDIAAIENGLAFSNEEILSSLVAQSKTHIENHQRTPMRDLPFRVEAVYDTHQARWITLSEARNG